jgi:GT2 family glycosyltransferase
MARILIAVPNAGGIEPDTLISIYNMDVPSGIETELKSFYGYLIDDARNKIVKHAIENRFDGILFVDSDMVIPKNTLTDMSKENKDIISALYIKKNDKKVIELFFKNENYVNDGLVIRNIREDEIINKDVIEIDACGFGCVLIKTSVFLRVGYPYFKFTINPNDDLLRVGEDIDFCIKAKSKGFKLYAATNIRAGHIGKKEYKL